jgi:hypothetical protein
VQVHLHTPNHPDYDDWVAMLTAGNRVFEQPEDAPDQLAPDAVSADGISTCAPLERSR